MHIWTLENWKNELCGHEIRHGLRMVFDKDVNSEVRVELKKFAAWLRKEYYFPLRVPVYIKNTERIIASDGDAVVGLFFEPDNRLVEPYIKLAVGDFDYLRQKRGHNQAIYALLLCFAHELTHYYQWINNIKLTDRGRERQATMYADYVLSEYVEAEEKHEVLTADS